MSRNRLFQKPVDQFEPEENVPIGTSSNPRSDVEVLSSTPMTQEEAWSAVDEINNIAGRIRQLLVELEEREGYRVLGFANMSQLMRSGLFAKARSSLQKELQAGRIENHYLNVPVGTFPEWHFRPLGKVKPEFYKPAFEQAAKTAGARDVTEKDVSLAVATMLKNDPSTAKKGIVDRLKQKYATPPSIDYGAGNVVMISSHGDAELRKHDGRLGVVQHVNNYSVAVSLYKEKDVLLVHPQFLEEVNPSCWSEVRAMHQRIAKLQECDLDPIDDAVLEVLSRKAFFTDRQKEALSAMEQFYGLQKTKN